MIRKNIKADEKVQWRKCARKKVTLVERKMLKFEWAELPQEVNTVALVMQMT